MATDVSFRLRHNLVTLLKDRNLTAAQLSRKTGVAKQVLSDWMSGVQPRKIEHLYSVAKALEVSMESLCFAPSENDLLSYGRNAPPPKNTIPASITTHGGSFGSSDNQLNQTFFTPDEIRGRFEIHLRRISDD